MKRVTVTANDTKTRLLVAFLIAESIDFKLDTLIPTPPVSLPLNRLIESKKKTKVPRMSGPQAIKTFKKKEKTLQFSFATTNKVLMAILATARGVNVSGNDSFSAREVATSCTVLGLKESNAGAGIAKAIRVGILEKKITPAGHREYSLTSQGWDLIPKLLPDVPAQA